MRKISKPNNGPWNLIGKLSLSWTERIPDVGCGDGKVTEIASLVLGGHVIGVDNSIPMIGAIAVGIEIKVMIEARTVRLADLLLLFIYLEVLAMVAMYLDSGKLPVRMSLYIAIVTLAVLAHRYGHTTPPYRKDEEG